MKGHEPLQMVSISVQAGVGCCVAIAIFGTCCGKLIFLELRECSVLPTMLRSQPVNILWLSGCRQSIQSRNG
jgi:hypothetical protein